MKGFNVLIFNGFLALVFGCFFVGNVEAKTQLYAQCIESLNPSLCLVNIAAKSRYTSSVELFEGVVMTGAVDMVKLKPKALLQGARESLHIQMPANAAQKKIEKSKDVVMLAAVALASAAQRQSDPFIDPTVQDLITKSRDVVAVAVIAAKFWFEIDTYDIFNKKETFPPGLPRIWSVIVTAQLLDEKLLVNLATADSFTQNAQELQLPLYKRFLSLAETSSKSKVTIASVFSNQYGYVEDAKKLMAAKGGNADNYDIEGVMSGIAEAQLLKGYDADAAQLVVKNLQREDVLEYTSYRCLCESSLQALQVAHANDELKLLAETYLEQAKNTQRPPEQRANFYALSSDCYLRAGEKKRAIETAKLGLPIVPLAVFYRLDDEDRTVSVGSPQEQARLARGFGTYPVVALYRAGAVDEALATGYLAGHDRYESAVLVGERPNPQWVIDGNWDLGINLMVLAAIENPDINIRLDVYSALKKWSLENSTVLDEYDNREHLAVLAASIGDKEAMISHLSDYARHLDSVDREEAAYFAIELAEQWLRDVRILAAQKR